MWMWNLNIGWMYTMSKFVDLMDTIFFVMRKNFHQISTLHVFHHTMIPFNAWLGFKLIPSSSVVFFPFVNSFVHAIMYLYYGLSALGPQMRPYLWWKRYVTILQTSQIALIGIQCVVIE